MIIPFNKYQGTGNDFIIIDNMKGNFNPGDAVTVKKLCDRRFGIGADGLILISGMTGYDFEMKYFNSDGRESTMCGNGGRCAASFALANKIAGSRQKFSASDGMHEAVIENDIVRLRMNDVTGQEIVDGHYFLNTGSPHYVVFRNDAETMDVFTEGKRIRWSDKFAPGGTNVNFAMVKADALFVRTFERGVEDETLSCGTGVTASAIAAGLSGHFDRQPVKVITRGGKLTVHFSPGEKTISDIWLCGPAEFVFRGMVEV